MTVPGNVIMVAVVGRGVYWMAGEPCKTASGARVYVTVRAWLTPLARFLKSRPEVMQCFGFHASIICRCDARLSTTDEK